MEPSNEAPSVAAEATTPSQETVGTPAHGPEQWAPQFWANSHQVGLRFASAEEFDAAIDWL